jgi:hypothetical protein
MELQSALGVIIMPPNRQDLMTAKDREVAESAFEKNKRREAEINTALRQEQARHEAAVKNMHRLRSLRMQRDAQKGALRVERDARKSPAKRKAH